MWNDSGISTSVVGNHFNSVFRNLRIVYCVIIEINIVTE